jgi:hypothetical protein
VLSVATGRPLPPVNLLLLTEKVDGDAVIYLRPERAARARFGRKQAGQLASTMRFIAAQFDALLTNDLWLSNAENANRTAAMLAEQLAAAPDVEILRPPQANSLFARLPGHVIEPLQDWSFFWLADALRKATTQGNDLSSTGTYDAIVGALGRLLQANISAGALREGVDPHDVILALAGLWQLDAAGDWRAQAQRLYGIVLGGLQAAPPHTPP